MKLRNPNDRFQNSIKTYKRLCYVEHMHLITFNHVLVNFDHTKKQIWQAQRFSPKVCQLSQAELLPQETSINSQKLQCFFLAFNSQSLIYTNVPETILHFPCEGLPINTTVELLKLFTIIYQNICHYFKSWPQIMPHSIRMFLVDLQTFNQVLGEIISWYIFLINFCCKMFLFLVSYYILTISCLSLIFVVLVYLNG